jgi:hypothetical protein
MFPLSRFRDRCRNKISGALWTPGVLAPQVWYDAADSATITLNGSTVSQWSDKSGNGFHAVQATAAAQPTYNATTYNNKPGLVFDGLDDILRTSSAIGVAGANPRTFVLVARGPGSPRGPVLQVGTQALLQAFGRDYGGSVVLYHWASDLPFSAPAIGVNYQELMQSTGAVSSAYRNGSLINSGSYALNTFNSRLYIGGRSLPDFSSASYGSIIFAEILVFLKVLSDTERQQLEGYLAWKWGGA